jgi:hypothetical protein
MFRATPLRPGRKEIQAEHQNKELRLKEPGLNPLRQKDRREDPEGQDNF